MSIDPVTETPNAEGVEWARNSGRQAARLGYSRAVPLIYSEGATAAFVAGYDEAKAEKKNVHDKP